MESVRTNQPLSEKELSDIVDRFQSLTAISNDCIVIVQQGQIKEANQAVTTMCGYSLDEIIDSHFAGFFQTDDISNVEAFCSGIGNQGIKASSQKATLVCKNGKRLKVEIRAAGCNHKGKPAALILVKDISDRLKAKGNLEKAGRLDSIAALSGGIAHDYNNLLTAIIGNITLAQSYSEPESKAAELLNQALIASKTAKVLTQKLITFSKGGSPDKEVARIAPLVRSATEFSLSGSNIKCEFKFPKNLWLVEMDKTQIGQAIYNVVINAREAMDQGGILNVSAANLRLTKKLRDLRPGNYIKITIADRGKGIAADDVERVFDPYFSTKELGTKRGTGLGLSISYSIIKKHGGEVVVESEIEEGTTVHFFLPALDKKSLAKEPAKKARTEKPIFGSGRILVMDDEEMIRDLAGEILIHLGYEVAFAVNGTEAVAKYEQAMAESRPFNAVILDLTVRGGMGGKETIQKLKEIDPQVIGIVSSGYAEDPGMVDFKAHGFTGVVAKPYSMEELGENLNRILQQGNNSPSR